MKRRRNFIFYFPHSSYWFKTPIRQSIQGIKLPNKYSDFFDFIVDSDFEVYLASPVTHGGGLKGFFKTLLDPVKLMLWCMLNRVSLRRIKFMFSIEKMKSADYIFFMHFGEFDNVNPNRGAAVARSFSNAKVKKLVHLTHYAFYPSEGIKNLKLLRPDWLIAENNLASNSEFYAKYFSDIGGKFLTLPYTISRRFVKKTPFQQRENRIVATGSITHKMKDVLFIEFFGTDELQPMRRNLYDQSHLFTGQLDCLISDYQKEADALNSSDRVSETESSLRKRAANLKYLIKKVKGFNPQRDYYRKNIVDIYNSYKMFVVPEEICDLPAIGFVEGMACGSAFFGLDDPMYRDLGLIPGIHYVSYDGTITDLMDRVRYYQTHTDELELIANQGYEFVSQNFKPDLVYEDFTKMLERSE